MIPAIASQPIQIVLHCDSNYSESAIENVRGERTTRTRLRKENEGPMSPRSITGMSCSLRRLGASQVAFECCPSEPRYAAILERSQTEAAKFCQTSE